MSIINDFEFHRPDTVEKAQALYHALPNSCYYAGGQGLLWSWKNGGTAPEHVIALRGIKSLLTVDKKGKSLYIGAGMTYQDLMDHDLMQKYLPSFVSMFERIADHAIRRRATFAGAAIQNDSSCDASAALIATGAIMHTNKRKIAVNDWFVDQGQTALEDGEIVLQIEVPYGFQGYYLKEGRLSLYLPIVGVFIAKFSSDKVAVGITGAAKCCFRYTDMEVFLSKEWTPVGVEEVPLDTHTLLSDIHAQADYRAHLIHYLIKRCVLEMTE